MPVSLMLHGRHAPTTRYEPLGPWLVPWVFSSLEEEYEALRAGAGLVDYSTQAFIEVRGKDRTAFLHNLLTNDIKRLSPGGGCRAALLTANGKLISDLLVLAEEQAHWLMCDVTRSAVVAETLNRYIFTEEVTVEHRERRWAALAIEGPRAIELLTQTLRGVVSLPGAGDHVKKSLEDQPVWLIRHSLTGRLGVLCLAEPDAVPAVWTLLQQRGAPFGLRLAGWGALNAARIETGVPWFGLDMDEDNLLPETGLETQLASDTKGCYPGQEIVARLQTYGSVNKRLVGLALEGADAPQPGDAIIHGGSPAGRVTSSGYSPALKRPVAMGYVKRGSYEPGTAVEIERNGRRLPASVIPLPASTGQTPSGG